MPNDLTRSSDKGDIADVFAEVRAGYGLLHAYHKRAKDTIALLVREMGGWNEAWHETRATGYSSRKRDVISDNGRWIWDFLPMHSATFFFVRDGVDLRNIGMHDVVLTIDLASDTSVFAPWLDTSDEEPSPDPERGRTGLQLSLFQVIGEDSVEEHFAQHAWDDTEWPLEEQAPRRDDTGDLIVASRFYPFENLSKRTAIRNAAEDFKTFVMTNWPDDLGERPKLD